MAKNFLALDVGEKRVGMALADVQVKIAIPFGYLLRDDPKIIQNMVEIILEHEIDTIIVGYPRNQSGEPTQQTALVESFVEQLAEVDLDTEIIFHDESLSSVEAERRLGRVQDKGLIDAEAASIILQDYMEVKL